ncbi:hypothetical protein [Streptomyces wuyuanensis]|uniref:hypothetical protein n=1 Tax=Streptomyces wuyuanensis TaxID=1196353 RepID=UPI003423E9E5
MTRTTCTQRIALITASTALAAGGALLPGSAFAAPAAQPGTVPAKAAAFDQHKHHDRDDNRGERKKKTKIVIKVKDKKIVIKIESRR